MLAARVHQLGSPDVIVVESIDVPEPDRASAYWPNRGRCLIGQRTLTRRRGVETPQ
jgi:hypothetical protein